MVSGDAITLEYKMQPGETLQYRTVVQSEQTLQEGSQTASGSSVMEMVMGQKATEVSPDGTMGVDVTIQSVSLKRDNEAVPFEPGQDPTGKTVSMKMKKSGEVIQTNMELPFSQPPFPTRAIKKGETWTGDSQIPVPITDAEGQVTGHRQVTLRYHYSLWDFTRKQGYDCAEIRVSCPESTIPLQDKVEQRISATGTTYFAFKEGRLVCSEVETDSQIAAQDVSIKNHIKVRVELENAGGSAAPPAPTFAPGVSLGGGDDFIIR